MREPEGVQTSNQEYLIPQNKAINEPVIVKTMIMKILQKTLAMTHTTAVLPIRTTKMTVQNQKLNLKQKLQRTV